MYSLVLFDMYFPIVSFIVDSIFNFLIFVPHFFNVYSVCCDFILFPFAIWYRPFFGYLPFGAILFWDIPFSTVLFWDIKKPALNEFILKKNRPKWTQLLFYFNFSINTSTTRVNMNISIYTIYNIFSNFSSNNSFNIIFRNFM